MISTSVGPTVNWRTIFVVYFHRFLSWTSTFLRPFAPPTLTGFHAIMNALTPERRFFVHEFPESPG